MLTLQDLVSIAYVALMGIGITFALILMIYAARRAHTSVGQSYLFMVTSMGLVIVCFFLHSVAPTVELTRFFTRLRFVFFPFVPVFSLYYVAAYTGSRDMFRLPVQLFLIVIPFITAIVVMTPALENWFWVSWDSTEYGLVRVELPRYGLGYYVFNLQNFCLVMVFYTMLIRYSLRSSATVRRRTVWIGAGHFFAYLIVLLTIFGGVPRGSLNLTPLGFTVLVTYMLFTAVRFRILDAIPLAHEQLLRLMQDPIVITDLHGRVIDANLLAESLLGAPRDELWGKRASELVNISPAPVRRLLDAPPGKHEISVRNGISEASYDVNISVLTRETGGSYGHMLVFRDITERKYTEKQREEMIRDLDAYAHIVAHDLKNPLSIVSYRSSRWWWRPSPPLTPISGHRGTARLTAWCVSRLCASGAGTTSTTFMASSSP